MLHVCAFRVLPLWYLGDLQLVMLIDFSMKAEFKLSSRKTEEEENGYGLMGVSKPKRVVEQRKDGAKMILFGLTCHILTLCCADGEAHLLFDRWLFVCNSYIQFYKQGGDFFPYSVHHGQSPSSSPASFNPQRQQPRKKISRGLNWDRSRIIATKLNTRLLKRKTI